MEMDDQEISKDDFLQWMDDRVSRAFIAAIRERIKDLYIATGNGTTLDSSNANSTLAETAKNVGKIEVLQEILDIDIIKE